MLSKTTARISFFMVFVLCITEIASDKLLNSSLADQSTIQINQAFEYKLKLGSKEQKIIKFNLEETDTNIELDISSSASYELCLLNYQNQCSVGFKKHSKKENSLIFTRQQLANGLKIRNPILKKKIKVKISFHLEDQQCHKLENKVFHRKQLKHDNCFLFEMNKQEDFQLLVAKQKIMDLKYQLHVCDQKFDVGSQFPKNNKFILKFTEIIKLCKTENNRTLRVTITHDQQQNNTDCKTISYIGIILQYALESILLTDGIAYSSTFSSMNIAKRFEYQLLNKENTTINVLSQSSLQIYVKVVEQGEKDKAQPSSSNFDFSSKSGFIFTYFKPYITLSKQVLESFKCIDCYLVIGIFAASNLAQIGKGHFFNIEITQSMSTLVTGEMKHHFLQAGAVDYYTFTAFYDTVVVYQLADNNKNCAMFYLSDQQVPGPNNFIKRSDKNRILYQSDQNKAYYISVIAEQDCAYSISATIASTELTTLEKGRFGYLNLLKNQTKFFLIHAEYSQYLKILSLHKYGSVQIYLNRTDTESIKKFNSKLVDYTTFQMKGQYMNRLLLTKDDPLFCEGCYYLIAVVGKKLTESTLFYGDEHTPIPINEKVINDMIPNKGEKVIGQYEGQAKFELQVKIHSGKLKITITKGIQKFSQNYEQIDEITTEVIDLGSTQSFFQKIEAIFFLEPIRVEFQALQDNTIYSVRFKQPDSLIIPTVTNYSSFSEPAPQPAPYIQKYDIQPGHDLFILVSSQNPTSVSGYWRDSSEKLLFSTDIDQSDQLSQLSIVLTADSKQIQYKIQKMSNILTLSVPKLKNYSIKEGIKYQLSISTNVSNPFWLTLMQTEDFQLLPPQVYTDIHDAYTFVTHTQGELIVELFQCKGKSNLDYASSREKLNQNQSQTLDVVGLPNQPHALRIYRFTTTFYEVTVKQGILRWFPFNLERGIGTGYVDYKVGSLRYENTFTSINLIWQSLALASTKTKTANKSIVSIEYTLYVAGNYEDLSESSQCQPFLVEKRPQILKFTNLVDNESSSQTNRTFSYSLKQKQLKDKYGQNATLYATITADLVLAVNTSSETKKERYRFIYPQVQLPSEVIQTGYVSAVVQSTYNQLISAVLLVSAAVIVSTYLLTAKLLPILGRLKNRYFVEENEQQMQNVVVSQNQNEEIPQSSDRRGSVNTQEGLSVEQNKAQKK